MLFDEVKSGLKEHLKNSAYTPVLKTFASGDTFPYVVIEKSNDFEGSTDLQRFNVIDSLEIEINIFAKKKVEGVKTISNRSVAIEIEEHIKNYFRELGFKRTYDKPTPNLDMEVYRITMRFRVNANTRRNYFI